MKRLGMLLSVFCLSASLYAGMLDFPGYIWARADQNITTEVPGIKGQLSWEQGIRSTDAPYIIPYVGVELYKFTSDPAYTYGRFGIKNTTLIPSIQIGIEQRTLVSHSSAAGLVFYISLYREWK